MHTPHTQTSNLFIYKINEFITTNNKNSVFKKIGVFTYTFKFRSDLNK